MARIEIGRDRAVELLREAVAARGAEYVYSKPVDLVAGHEDEPCLYVHRGPDGTACPGCGVGDALHRAGVPLLALARYEGENAEAICRGLELADDAMAATLVAVMVFSDFQSWQDAGWSWGHALAKAEAGEGNDLNLHPEPTE